MEQQASALFTRVRDMIAECVGWIGAAMSRDAFRKAQALVRKIETDLRMALYMLAVKIPIQPVPAAPETPLRGTPVTSPALSARKGPASIGLFNPCLPAEQAEPPAPRRPQQANIAAPRSTGAPASLPDTETLLRRIARMQAVLEDPHPYAVRVARHLDATVTEMTYTLPTDLPLATGADRRPDAKASAQTRSLFALQPKWPPG